MFNIGDRVKFKVRNQKGFGSIVAVEGDYVQIQVEETRETLKAHVNLVQRAKRQGPHRKTQREVSLHARQRIKERFRGQTVASVKAILKTAPEVDLKGKIEPGNKSLYDQKNKMVLIVDDKSKQLITTYKNNLHKVVLHKEEAAELKEAMEDLRDYAVPSNFDHRVKKTYKKSS